MLQLSPAEIIQLEWYLDAEAQVVPQWARLLREVSQGRAALDAKRVEVTRS